MFEAFKRDDDGGTEGMREFLSPAQVDQSVRQALYFCWMMLPKDKRSPEETERQFRRIVDRALQNFREDSHEFGKSA